MFKSASIALAILILAAGGCTGRSQTKEELFNEGMKQVEAKSLGSAIIYFKNALEKDQNYFDARFQLARAYSAIGKYDAAEKELKKVLHQRPDARDAHIEIARVYVQSNKPDDALSEIAGLAGDVERDVEVMEIVGWSHAVKGNYSTAIALLKKAMATQPARSSAALMLSKTYLLMGNMQAAHALINGLLKSDPGNRSALYFLAEIQTRERDAESAIKTYDLLIQRAPSDSEAFFRKGLLSIEQARYDEALAASEMIIKNFPNRPEGLELKGIGLFYKKQYKDAIIALQKAVSFQANSRTYYFLGLCHFYIEELEQAMNQLQRALDLNPSYGQARVLASLIYLKKNNVDAAVSEIRKALVLDEQNALGHSILGSAYLAKGMYAQGVAELNRAIALDPKLVDARLKKGIFQLSRGKVGEAEAELSAAVRINPEVLNSRIMLASSYLKRNEFAKAIMTAREGIRGQKADAVLYNVIADILLRQHKAADAMNALQKAKEADPLYDVTYFKLAVLHRMAGEQEKGLEELKALAARAPDNVQAQLALASLLETKGNVKEASAYYEGARKTGKTEGAYEAARYYLRNNKPDRTLTVLDEALQKNPSAPALLALKGQTFLIQKKFEDAAQTYEELAKINAGAGFAAVINTYLAMNKPEKALERVRREMKGSPDRLDLMGELSRIYITTGKTQEAVENARQMIGQHPDSAIGYMTLAWVYQSTKEFDKSIDVLRRAKTIKDVNLTMMLGNLYAAKKDYPSAIEQYGKAEAIKKGYVPAIFQKASLLHTMGKKKEAIAEYQRVVRLAQDHVPALNNLAYLYAEDRSTLSTALQYAVQAYVLAPRDGSVQDTLGFVLLKNGKVDEGLQALKLAAASVPDNPSVCYHLALAYKEHNEKSEAVAYLQKAFGLGDFPEYLEAKALLAQLNNGTGPRAR